MFRPQNVQYNSPNMMKISQKFSGGYTSDTLLLVYSIPNRNKRLFHNLCAPV